MAFKKFKVNSKSLQKFPFFFSLNLSSEAKNYKKRHEYREEAKRNENRVHGATQKGTRRSLGSIPRSIWGPPSGVTFEQKIN